jgi:hypothetical protein
MELTQENVKEMNKNFILFFEKAIKNYELGDYFRFCANLDLINAKELNDARKSKFKSATQRRKHIPQIIYLIQQCVEKYAKAYALIFGAIDKKGLRMGKKAINHVSCKAFLHSLRQEDFNNILPGMKSFSKEFLKKDTSEIVQEINPIEDANLLEEIITKKEGSLRRMSIAKLLDKFEKARKYALKFMNKRNFSDSFNESYKPKYLPIIKYFFPKEKLENTRKHLINETNFISLIYPLAFLTYFYEADTRYPSEKGPKYYISKKNGIVPELDRIIGKLSQVDDDFKGLCSSLKKSRKLTKEERNKKYKLVYGIDLNDI